VNAFFQTGIFGILILIVTFALLVAIVVVLVAGNRKALLTLVFLGLLPLLLGVAGTALGYEKTNQATELVNDFSLEMVQEGHRMARLTTWMGAGCTLGLWVVALLGSLISKLART
jgi:hypothetical protein